MYVEFDVNARKAVETKVKSDIYFELYKCGIISSKELVKRLHELEISFDT